ncbi:MAG: hypothetical protein RR589_18390 [Hafnia sp.]|uniref:hypothetical protein n=1 Tax=Hafnia sp. TaxID=1873498 RepID=UPI002FC97070
MRPHDPADHAVNDVGYADTGLRTGRAGRKKDRGDIHPRHVTTAHSYQRPCPIRWAPGCGH